MLKNNKKINLFYIPRVGLKNLSNAKNKFIKYHLHRDIFKTTYKNKIEV